MEAVLPDEIQITGRAHNRGLLLAAIVRKDAGLQGHEVVLVIGVERLLSEYVPWRSYLADDMVQLHDDSVMMVISVDGLASETINNSIINERHNKLEFALREASTIGLIYHFLQCRGVADASIYPHGSFRSDFARNLDRKYRERLFGNRLMWLNRTYLSIILPPRQIGGKKLNKLLSWGAKDYEAPEEQMQRLRRIVGVLCEHLKVYSPRVLGVEKRRNFLYSGIAEAICFAMTGYWREVPLTTSGPASVFSEKFFIGKETFELRMPLESAWGACIGINDYPYITSPGMFDRFLSASYRHTLFQAFRCVASIDGQALATRKQNRMKLSGDRALSQANELTAAADLIAGNRLMIGEHANVLTLFTDNPASLQQVVQAAWGDLAYGGVKIERESITLEAVLFSKIPGNFHLRGRQAAVSSRNFAAFAAMHNFPGGQKSGFWGDPLMMLRTSGGTPYLFHLHHQGVGNTLVSGRVGSGKTVFLGLMVCQAERSGAKVVLWDKDRGLEALVHAVGGSYLSLVNTPGIGTGLSPLRRLTDDAEDVDFLSRLIRACIATPEPYDLTPEEDRRLGIAVRHVMSGPPDERNLSEIRSFLGSSRTGAGARLEKWCHGGEFGWVIDCQTDIVNLDNKVIAFDQSALLENPIAAGAVMATLFHYTGKLVDGRRLLFILDEVWNALEIEQFLGEIKNGLKTWRKFNSPVITATQSIDDALNSPIGQTFKQQTPTQIFFSNPGASWEYHGPSGLNLSATEFDIIKRLPEGTGHFLLHQGNQSVVLQAPLGGMDELKVISGTRTGSDAIRIARQRVPDATGLPFVEAYHEALEELAQ